VKTSQNGIELIKSFEGCVLVGYPDIGGIPTVGYGSTGPDVHVGMKITQAEAERRLAKELEHFENGVSNLVKVAINQNEFDALVSFSFNVGLGAFQRSTLLRLLNDGTERDIVSSEFLRWNKVDGKPVEGLTRRRKAEQALFLTEIKHPKLASSILAEHDTWLKRRPVQSSELAAEEKLFVPKGSAWAWTEMRIHSGERHQQVVLEAQPDKEWWIFPNHWKIINDTEPQEGPQKPDGEIKLVVPYFSQRDNQKDPYRTCFSSSCAMLLATLDPDAIEGDDEYINEVYKIGDSTEASAQIGALKHFGLDAKFVQNAGWDTIEAQLKKSIPVPIGILHKGPVSSPSGGGHWICVVGITADRSKLWVHDPFGELDLVGGTYVSTDGKYKLYSKKNLGPRWLVEGGNSGWAIIAK
jgi:lysozyme